MSAARASKRKREREEREKEKERAKKKKHSLSVCVLLRAYFLKKKRKKISRRKQKNEELIGFGFVPIRARFDDSLSLFLFHANMHTHTTTTTTRKDGLYTLILKRYTITKNTHIQGIFLLPFFFTKLSYFWGLCLNPSNSLFLSCLSRTNASTSFCKLCSFWTNHSAVNAPATAKPAWI